MVQGLRYNLRKFGRKLEGPVEVYCDNKSMVTNSNEQASLINKRHNDICYNVFIEAQAAGMLREGWIPCGYNLAYLLTKTKMTRNMRHGMVEPLSYNKAGGGVKSKHRSPRLKHK